MAEDNWEHRAVRMRCKTCMWFVEKVAAEPLPDDLVVVTGAGIVTPTSPPSFGRCRKHAPTMTGYPAVFGTDWCGDHKMDEGKIG